MSATIPAISAVPAAPDPAAGQDSFDLLAYPHFDHIASTLQPELEAFRTAANTLASEAEADAAAAETARTLAETASDDAVLAVNTPAWAAATNWPTGTTVRSPTDLQLYTRKTPGGINATDPATDAATGSGTYWTRTPVMTTVSPQVVSAAKTFALADAHVPQLHPGSDVTARAWTIPANASVPYPVGTIIPLINGYGAGILTIAITTDTLRWAGTASTGSRTLAANGNACLVKVATTEWQIVGAGLA